MLIQFAIGVLLVAALATSVRRSAITHDMNFQLVTLWLLGTLLLTVGLGAFLRQDLFVDTFRVSVSAAATVVSSVLLISVTFSLSKLQGSSEQLAREAAISIAAHGAQHWEVDRHARSTDDVLIVIPAFNEEQTIRDVIVELIELDFRCLVVNDGSLDGTSEIAERAGAWVVDLPTNMGIGAALRVGWKIADQLGYHYAIQCDADGQHDPKQISVLLDRAISHDVDLLIGSRFAEDASRRTYETSAARRIAMRVLARRATKVSGVQMTDSTSGFRCISQPLLHEFALRYPVQYMESYESLIAAAESGWNVQEVAVTMAARKGGVASHGKIRSLIFLVRVVTIQALGASAVVRTKIERSPH